MPESLKHGTREQVLKIAALLVQGFKDSGKDSGFKDSRAIMAMVFMGVVLVDNDGLWLIGKVIIILMVTFRIGIMTIGTTLLTIVL